MNLIKRRIIALGFAVALGGALVGACWQEETTPFAAAARGDLATLKTFVDQDPMVVKATHGSGLTPLHYAASNGQTKIIDFLVAQGAEVEARDDSGHTPLHAALSKQPEAVALLVALGADVNAQDDLGQTPLHHAANWMFAEKKQEPTESIERLITLGAKVDARNDLGWTPLFVAAEDNWPEAIELLVSKGADVNARDRSGHTPLIWAAMMATQSPLEAVKTLVRLGADPKARQVRPGDVGKFKGRNVLSIAASRGRLDVVKYLLEQGVPVRYGEGDDEETALHHAVAGLVDPKRVEEHIAVIDLLVKELDGDVNDSLPSKFNMQRPLWIAAEHGNVEIVRHLLENYPAIDIEQMRTTVTYLKKDESRPKRTEALALIRSTLTHRIEARDAEFLREHHAQDAGDRERAADQREVKSPVFYRHQMLVLVAPQGVAAVVFGESVDAEPRERTIKNGPLEGRVIKEHRYHEVPYRYRFLPAGKSDEVMGEGRVFRKSPMLDEDGGIVPDTGEVELWVKAGEIKLKWSRLSSDGGWVSYRPEEMAVLIAEPLRFADYVSDGQGGPAGSLNWPGCDSNNMLRRRRASIEDRVSCYLRQRRRPNESQLPSVTATESA